MKIFVAGASGAAGSRLVPKLVASGHEVVGTTRDPNKAAALQALGVEPVVLDALDQSGVNDAVKQAEPEVIISQLTSLSDLGTNFRKFDQYFAATNRLRTEGTANLLAAGREVGTRRLVTQGYASWNNLRQGGPAKTEAEPLDPTPVRHSELSARAIVEQEAMLADVPDVETVVLRYANFYGPGTGISTDATGTTLQAIRQRKFPIVGKGTGVWSFIHIDDAMDATVLAAGDTPTGVFNVADDEPAPVKEWLPYLCQAIDAKPPMHLPRFVGSLVGGPLLVSMMENIRGSDNAKARRELGWTPRWPTWREGFKSGLSD